MSNYLTLCLFMRLKNYTIRFPSLMRSFCVVGYFLYINLRIGLVFLSREKVACLSREKVVVSGLGRVCTRNNQIREKNQVHRGNNIDLQFPVKIKSIRLNLLIW